MPQNSGYCHLSLSTFSFKDGVTDGVACRLSSSHIYLAARSRDCGIVFNPEQNSQIENVIVNMQILWKCSH